MKGSIHTSIKALCLLVSVCAVGVCSLTFSAVHANTLYFDGEDSSTAQWQHYVGDQSAERLQNVFDAAAQSRVIQIQGSTLNQGSLLGGGNSTDGWNNQTDFTLSWRMSIDSIYLIEIPVDTLAGKRQLIYQAHSPSSTLSGSSIYLSLGADSLQSQWSTYERDLSSEIEKSEPGNRLLAVNGFSFRGSGRLDDIQLSPIDPLTKRVKEATNNKVETTASEALVADFKVTYAAYSMAELMVRAADGDRLANVELSLRLATGSRGAPKSQTASLRQYDTASQRSGFSSSETPHLPIDRFGVPAIRIDRTASNLQSVAPPSAKIALSAVQGHAPLTLMANASSSTTFNGSSLLAWSDSSLDAFSASRFLGSAQSLMLFYPHVGEYVLRLLLVDDQGNISADNRFVSVDVPVVATAPSSVVLQQGADGLLNVLTWTAASSSISFDIRLVSAAGVVLGNMTDILLSPHCSGGVCSLTLPAVWVMDNGDSVQMRSYDAVASSDWVTSAMAPQADAGPNRGHVQGDSITVYGGNSIDSDGTIASYQWRESGVLLGQGASVNVQLPLGTHTIELTVTDNSGYISSDQMQVTVFAKSHLSIGNNVNDVVKVVDALQVSKSQISTQMTPIATADGYLYTANIEHGPNGDEDGSTLHTVVRKGTQSISGLWSWESVVIEDRTVYDEWHTAPSVAVDNDGQVHVVYNMHNVPWQYKRSALPHDIQSFEFHGQAISQAQIDSWKIDNSTYFPSFGYADIPGTQITYPRFEKDPNDELYLTYRFASRPKRSWPERTFGIGLAEYSRVDKTWTAIGEPLDVTADDFDYHPDAPLTSSPFAAKTGWTAYHPSMVFNDQSGMGVVMLWRSGTAGASTSKPCFAWSDNKLDFNTMEGVPLSLPLQPEACSNLGFTDSDNFNNIADSEMDSQGNIFLVLSPVAGASVLLSYTAATGQWQESAAPLGATEIFVDADDNLWAVASGPRISKRTSLAGAWQTIYSETGAGQCYPRATLTSDGSAAFIHTIDCDRLDVSIYGVRLKP